MLLHGCCAARRLPALRGHAPRALTAPPRRSRGRCQGQGPPQRREQAQEEGSCSWSRGAALRDAAATARVAAALARAARPGDVVFLRGDVGAGKSTLARAALREACQDARLQVPSPTYTLRNDYSAADGRCFAHMDLYRLGEGGSRGKEAAASSLGRLQLDEAFAGAVSLIEWPERLPAAMVPQRRLELRLTIPAEARPSAANGWSADEDEDGAPRHIEAVAFGRAGEADTLLEALNQTLREC